MESAPGASHPLVVSAKAALECGEFARAEAYLESLRPSDLIGAEDARAAGLIGNGLGRRDMAIDFFSRSLELRDDRDVRQALAQTCEHHFHDLSDASLETVRRAGTDDSVQRQPAADSPIDSERGRG